MVQVARAKEILAKYPLPPQILEAQAATKPKPLNYAKYWNNTADTPPPYPNRISRKK